MKRNPRISKSQIRRGLCGIKGCTETAGRSTIPINGQQIPVCSGHRRKRLANIRAKTRGKR